MDIVEFEEIIAPLEVTNTADLVPTTYYVVEQYCFLCRNELPHFTCFSSTDEHEEWETKVLGFVDVSGDEDPVPEIFTFKLSINIRDLVYNPTFTVKNKQGRIKAVSILYEPPHHDSRPAFFTHVHCWKASRMVAPRISGRELFHLAQQLDELFPRDCWGKEPLSYFVSLWNDKFSLDTDLASCLKSCVKLPAELQCMILRDIPKNSFTFSLLRVMYTLSLRFIYSAPSVSDGFDYLIIPPGQAAGIAHICASFVTIYGHSYVYRVRVLRDKSHHNTSGHQCITVNINSIRKIEFNVGLYGIMAVRFMLEDGSMTEWLGDMRKGWQCGPMRINRHGIDRLRNGHRQIVRRFARILARDSVYHPPARALWNDSWDHLDVGEVNVAQMNQTKLTRRLTCYPGRLMCTYLPLQVDGQYATGVTVYTSFYGTSCIITHVNGDDYVSSSPGRRGSPTSFFFQEGEEIVAIGLITIGHNDGQLGPYLLFTTNQQRVAYFGPPVLLADTTTRWLSLIPDRMKNACIVMGLAVDQLAIVNEGMKTIGAHCVPLVSSSQDGVPPPSPNLSVVVPVRPDALRLFPFNSGAAMSTARLYDIKQLRVQRKVADDWRMRQKGRCSGLWIHHRDGSIETLGVWNGSAAAPSDLIYDAETDGPLHHLDFHMTKGCRWKDQMEIAFFVSDIIAQGAPSGECQDEEQMALIAKGYYQIMEWEISESKPSMAWCFTDWIDSIGPCSSDSMTINLRQHEHHRRRRIK